MVRETLREGMLAKYHKKKEKNNRTPTFPRIQNPSQATYFDGERYSHDNIPF
jgi:hypothetical protein